MIRILYFGCYSLNNQRNSILIRGLRENGVEVLGCNDHSKLLLLKYTRLFFKFLKYIGKFDVMVVGFSGQEMMPLAKFLTRKPIIFDVFTSHYMGYILDRKYFSPDSFRAKYYRFLDRWSCRLADVIILDTQAHIDYFVKEFSLNPAKFRKIWLGANSGLFYPRTAAEKKRNFSVIFWGNFIPLQGIEYIVRAAKILEGKDMIFYLIGAKGQTFEKNKELAEELGLKNVVFTGRLSDEEMNRKIAEADICLGAFSGSIKADVTIQNKIFEAMASEKAVITTRTSAIQELLTDGTNCLLCNKTDSEDLADKISVLKNNPVLRDQIARNAYKLFVEKLTEKKLGRELLKIIEEIS